MIFLQRSGVCDPHMHFIDNQRTQNHVQGSINQFQCNGAVPDTIIYPQSSVFLLRILTDHYCINQDTNYRLFYPRLTCELCFINDMNQAMDTNCADAGDSRLSGQFSYLPLSSNVSQHVSTWHQMTPINFTD